MGDHEEITLGLADYYEGRLSSVTLRSLISLMKNERDDLRTKLAKAEAQRDKLVEAANQLLEAIEFDGVDTGETPWGTVCEVQRSRLNEALADIEKG